MSFIIPQAVKEDFTTYLKGLLESKGYEVAENTWDLTVKQEAASIRVSFTQSWNTERYGNKDYGWINFELRRSEKLRMKVKFKYVREGLNQIATGWEAIDRKKFYEKTAEMISRSQRYLDSVRKMEAKHDRNAAAFHEVFPDVKFYGTSGEINLDDGHARFSPSGDDWMVAIDVRAYGKLENLKDLIEAIQERIKEVE